MTVKLISLLFIGLPLLANAGHWKVVNAQSTLGFTCSYQNEPFKGHFRQFSADITYDPVEPATARFDVTVPLDSVDTQSSERDQTLTGADFFATSQFPTAHFTTATFDKAADGSVTAHGTLQLHGISKPVSLKIVFNQDGTGATLDVQTTLNRADFGLGNSDDWTDVCKQVPVSGHLVLVSD